MHIHVYYVCRLQHNIHVQHVYWTTKDKEEGLSPLCPWCDIIYMFTPHTNHGSVNQVILIYYCNILLHYAIFSFGVMQRNIFSIFLKVILAYTL